ncbi:MAG TPA: DUF1810 domain-containing protein [Casimicrobium sp.]|nr:DUF1810 domain-containing protein [Casimicrobium sp.]
MSSLDRFLLAQESVYESVLQELAAGYKRTHWMWFVFPQFLGLGTSEMATTYAIRSVAEAASYLQHPLLGNRLVECTRMVVAIDAQSAEQIFGVRDAYKFLSCMTLFANVSDANSVFAIALKKYFPQQHCAFTLLKLRE